MRIARQDEFNGTAIDRYTLVHLMYGTAMGLLGAPATLTLSAAALWEFTERPLKDAFPERFPHPLQDRPINMLTDVLAAGVGWWIGQTLRRDDR